MHTRWLHWVSGVIIEVNYGWYKVVEWTVLGLLA